MKTLTNNKFSLFKLQYTFNFQPLCERIIYYLRSSLLGRCLQSAGSSRLAQKSKELFKKDQIAVALSQSFLPETSLFMARLPMWRYLLRSKTAQVRSCYVRASRALYAGLNALVAATTVNRRIYVGLVLMFVIAPAVYCIYYMFDREQHIEAFFHVNFFHFFFLLRFQTAFAVFFIGLYHFLEQDKRVKILAAPLGFLFMSIAMNVMAENNEQIWNIVDWVLLGAGVCLALTIFFGLDYFVWRKFHRADAFEARLEGIFNIADDIPADKVKSMFITVWRERKEFKAKN